MCLSISCIPLVSYLGFPPLASPQFFAFMLFQYPNFSCTPVPRSNFLHAFGFNISASPVSQQFFALIWFQYLTSPAVPFIKFVQFPALIGFNIYALQGVQRPSPCNTLGFPPALFFSISTLHTSSGLSVTQGLNLVSTCVEMPHLGAFIWSQYPSLCLKTSPLVG